MTTEDRRLYLVSRIGKRLYQLRRTFSRFKIQDSLYDRSGQGLAEFAWVMAALLLIATLLAALMMNPNGGALPAAHDNVTQKIAND